MVRRAPRPDHRVVAGAPLRPSLSAQRPPPCRPEDVAVVAGAPLRPSLSGHVRRPRRARRMVVAGAPLRPSLSDPLGVRFPGGFGGCSRSTPPAFVERWFPRTLTFPPSGVVAGAPLRPSLSVHRLADASRCLWGCSRSTPPAFVERGKWTPGATRGSARCSRSTPPAFVERSARGATSTTLRKVVAGAPLRPSLSGPDSRRVRPIAARL